MNQTKCMFFRHNRTTVSQPTLNGSSRGAFDFTTMSTPFDDKPRSISPRKSAPAYPSQSICGSPIQKTLRTIRRIHPFNFDNPGSRLEGFQEGCGFTQQPGDPFRSRFSPIPNFRPEPSGFSAVATSPGVFFRATIFIYFRPNPSQTFQGLFVGSRLESDLQLSKDIHVWSEHLFSPIQNLQAFFFRFGDFCSDSF